MLHSMTIRLIHVHQLETLYLCYGVKGQPGVIWGHRGQKVIFTKNATSTDYMAWLCNSCIYIHKLETLYSIHGVKVNLGSLPPANIMRLCPDLFPDLVLYTVAVCDCVFLLYDFFLLLLLLSTLQSLISPTWLDRFWPDLVTSTGWPSHLSHMTRLGSKVT